MEVSIGTNCDFRRIAGYRSMTAAVRSTTATVDGAVYRAEGHASVNLCLSQLTWSTTTNRNRTEQNLIVRSRKSDVIMPFPNKLIFWLKLMFLLVTHSATKHRTDDSCLPKIHDRLEFGGIYPILGICPQRWRPVLEYGYTVVRNMLMI